MKKFTKLDRCMLEHALNYLYGFNKRECSIYIKTMQKELGEDSVRIFEENIEGFIKNAKKRFHND